LKKIHFTVKCEDLLQAMSVVSVVQPRPVGNAETSGYLFLVKGNNCSIYSRDSNHVTRAQLTVDNLSGEGLDDVISGKAGTMFAFPTKHTSGFSFFKSGNITFDATQDGNVFRVSAVGDRKGATAWRDSFDPRQTRPCDKEFDEVRKNTDGCSFPTSVLINALSMAKEFIPTDKDGVDPRYSVQIFDQKVHKDGDGYMFCTNGVQTLHYYSDAFKGKALSVHGSHLDLLQKFLARSPGKVKIYEGATLTFAENASGQLFGWNKVGKSFQNFGYYDGSEDQFNLTVGYKDVLEALDYLQTQMDDKDRKILMIYKHTGTDPSGGTLQFQLAEEGSKGNGITTWEVPNIRRAATMSPDKTDFSLNVSIDSVRSIFKPIAGSNQVKLCISILEKNRREQAYIRTIDDGVELVDGDTTCKAIITRYTPKYS